MKQNLLPFTLKSATLVFAMSALLTGCGGSDDNDDKKTNNAPTIEDASLTLKGGNTGTLTLSANDVDGDTLVYSIETAPTQGTATIDASTGVLEFSAAGVENGTTSTVVVKVFDGKKSATANITIDIKNTAPVASDAIVTLPFFSANNVEYQVSASDMDGDTLTYSISTDPTTHGATIDENTGKITFTIADFTVSDTMEVAVTDGSDSASLTVTINGHEPTQVSAKSFKHQFYKVTNPDTENSQIIHYNSETGAQTKIKDDVILGRNVFVMSGIKDGDKTVYSSRVYGIFNDPSAGSEIRQGSDGNGGTYEYTFYTDHILKAFDADNTATERVIFDKNKLSQTVKNAGINVIDSTTKLFLNETDIDDSYVQIMAYSELADGVRSELSSNNIKVPIAVRLSDSAQTQGRIIGLIKDSSGNTSNVLVNFIAPHRGANYPTGVENEKRLQSCDTSLTICTDVPNGVGNYFLLTQNDSHVYMTKEGDNKIFAYNKTANTITEVTGATYPANFNPDHHNISFASKAGHGSVSGIFSNLFNLLDINLTLSEGNNAYVAINYDLDTENELATVPGRRGSSSKVFAHKSSMIVKLTGTTGVKVYDNGDGIDHANSSDTEDTSYHIGLVALKDGHLLVEAGKYNHNDVNTCKAGLNCNNYKVAWLDTNNVTTAKTDFDNNFVQIDVPYFTANRVQPRVVGDYAYINEASASSSRTRVYNIYKMPLTDFSVSKTHASVTRMTGRMFMERTAFRDSGIYEGEVFFWDRNTSKITNSARVVIGSDADIETTPDSISNALSANGNNNITGVDGIFGLKLTTSHGGTGYLTSGNSGIAGSLTKVNYINGDWIVD